MQDEDNVQKTLFTYVQVNSVFIQAFENEAIKQFFFVSLSNADISHFGFLKRMKGGNFVPSTFATR